MNNNGQRRYARKQKNRKQQQKRSKVNAKRNNKYDDNNIRNQKQTYYSGRAMNVSDVVSALSLYCYNTILKNEQQKSTTRRRPSSPSQNSIWIPPSIFNDPDLVNVFRPSQEQIHHFIKIIFDKRRLAAETGVMGYVLMLRTNMKITSANWMRLVMVSLLLANKEAEDVYTVWNVRFVGIIPNLQVYEINLLEMEFLQSIKYRLHVEPEAYSYNYQQLVSHLPMTTLTEQPDLVDSEDVNISDSDSLTTDSECSIRSNSSDLLISDEECIDGISPTVIAHLEEVKKMDKMHSLCPTETGVFTENVSHIESIP